MRYPDSHVWSVNTFRLSVIVLNLFMKARLATGTPSGEKDFAIENLTPNFNLWSVDTLPLYQTV
jgi:hypothetical protein